VIQDVQRVNQLPFEIDARNQPAFVPMDVEDNARSNAISTRKGLPQIEEVFPFGGLCYLVPCF